jgi:hypothetical protein
MRVMSKFVLGTAAVAGLLATSAMSASADIACSGYTCWHVHEHYAYPRRAHVVVHPDDWRMSRRYVIREHEGPGYWHGGAWVGIGPVGVGIGVR